MSQLFGTDRVLMYAVDPWSRLGFGVPNFGSKSKMEPGAIDTLGTLNTALHGLADEIGVLQLFIMTHVDASRKQAPSRNTIERLGKLCNRANSVLSSRMMAPNQALLEPGHERPAVKIWNIHPVPYFAGPFLRNKWLMEYNELVMFALTNFYQHSDNNLALTVSQAFAKDIYQYFREIKIRMGTELLAIPRVDLEKDDFVFQSTHYDAYHPELVVTNIEAIDGPGNMFSLPTEVDLRPLLDGIPANLILPMLKQYPIGPIPGATGIGGEDTLDGNASAPGTNPGTAIGPAVI
ncbi:MAG: hypothetical protein AB7U73_01965 [Pirellulales bacterium]